MPVTVLNRSSQLTLESRGERLVEAESLPGDGGHAAQLELHDADIRRPVEIGAATREVVKETVTIERVVDLVRDSGSKAADRSEFFALQKGLFRVFLFRDVGAEDRESPKSCYRPRGAVDR